MRTILPALLLLVLCACQPPRAPVERSPSSPAPPASPAPAVAPLLPEAPAPPRPPRLVRAPRPATPPALVVMLHGFNSNEADLMPLAQLAADAGLDALSVPAPIVGGPGRFQWKRQDTAHTHAYLQAVVRAQRAAHPSLPGGRVWLVGFSQGALHSAALVAQHPEHYRGVLGISPGGWASLPKQVVAPERKRPFVLTHGRAEIPRYRAVFDAIGALATSGEQPLTSALHEGGHRFPADWRTRFAAVFASWAVARE